ncbi:Transmembrane and coiled-coil domain-containing protein [Zootermopsis nevadensis]|uniref:Coiled-coil domain-containing protein 167 n=1 Tax=Zootermopsis nevadensis TaxID=136037 RepID=A0A067QXY0_ZOONE|nr:Transmembrane and coiled-coil domain-containing protein [Zootermopsis nevadensis]
MIFVPSPPVSCQLSIVCWKVTIMAKNTCSIISEIEKAEESVKTCFYKVQAIEKSLKSHLISMEERERLEKELADVKSLLTQNESEIRNLRKENSKTFAVAVMIMFFAFLIYGIYVMVINPVKSRYIGYA